MSAQLIWITPDAERMIAHIAQQIAEVLRAEVPTILKAAGL